MSKKKCTKNILHSLQSISQLGLNAADYHQLAHAALGTIAPEQYSLSNLPISQGFSSRQYNRIDTIARAKKRLNQDDLHASVTASEIITELERAGVGVNQVQLFLDPLISKKTKKEAFSALRKNLFLNEQGAKQLPVTATVAIHSKMISSPDITWQGRFSVIAAYPRHPKNLLIARGKNRLVESIATTESYIWVFPPVDNKATCLASRDSYTSSPVKETAEMGMGFCIIQAARVRNVHSGRDRAQEEPYKQYTLHTPIWYLPSRDSEWTLGNIIDSNILDGAPWSDCRLKDLLPEGLESLPRIHACRKCRMLFIDEKSGYEDIPVSCNCVNTELA